MCRDVADRSRKLSSTGDDVPDRSPEHVVVQRGGDRLRPGCFWNDGVLHLGRRQRRLEGRKALGRRRPDRRGFHGEARTGAAGRRHRSGLRRVQGSSPPGADTPGREGVSDPASVTRPLGRARSANVLGQVHGNVPNGKSARELPFGDSALYNEPCTTNGGGGTVMFGSPSCLPGFVSDRSLRILIQPLLTTLDDEGVRRQRVGADIGGAYLWTVLSAALTSRSWPLGSRGYTEHGQPLLPPGVADG